MVASAAAGLCGAALTACQSAPESESIFAALKSAPPTPAEAATWMFDPYDSDRRFRGTVLLANAPFGGESVYLRGYEEHLGDPDSSVRAAAAFALGRHGGPEHVPKLIPLVGDGDRLVRLSAVRSLQRLHNPEAVPVLIERLDSTVEDDVDIRAAAAHALGQYPERRVLQGLIAALRDNRLAVTRNAAASLRTLTGMDFGDDRREWFQWVASATEPFAGRTAYTYPVFSRDRSWLEHIPFWSQPPNEAPAPPAGMPPVPSQTDGVDMT